MTPVQCVAVILCLVSAVGSGYAGVVTPLSSNRVVSVLNRETIPQTTQSFAGPVFGLWQSQAYAYNDPSQPNWNPLGSHVAVTSSQQSNFDASGIAFSGFVFIDYSFAVQPNPGVSATNRCDTVFRVDGVCAYQFQGTFTSNNVSETQGSLYLRNNATAQDVFAFTASGAQSGTLTPGDYTLSILIQGNSSGGSQNFDGRTQVDATFTIPTPAAAPMLLLTPLAIRRRRWQPINAVALPEPGRIRSHS